MVVLGPVPLGLGVPPGGPGAGPLEAPLQGGVPAVRAGAAAAKEGAAGHGATLLLLALQRVRPAGSLRRVGGVLLPVEVLLGGGGGEEGGFAAAALRPVAVGQRPPGGLVDDGGGGGAALVAGGRRPGEHQHLFD